ncbi:MAG: futalosine hydrolase [Bacteroidota bacterium]
MKILIASATYSEIAPLAKKCSSSVVNGQYFFSLVHAETEIDILITGVGIASTAFHLGKALSKTKYDYAFNFGIAGSFKKDIRIGDVVNVTTDIISELGAENGNTFQKFDELKMSAQTLKRTAYFVENKNEIQIPAVNEMFRVKGITVNTVHGHKTSIENIQRNFSPDVESMEGAAFLYACRHEIIKCVQIRAISNYVEERNIESWDTALAIKNLNKVALRIINSF